MTPTTPDLVFRGSYWTAGLDAPRRGAVAVTGDAIIAVEQSPAAVESIAAVAREVIDIGEGVLIPGIQDAHVHPVMAGLHRRGCSLHALDTADQFLSEIGRYARAHPDREWVTGSGWTFAAFPEGGPRKEALDALCGGRPAVMVVRDEHAAWISTAALTRAGITAATPDPPGGRIERDRSGEPTGVLHEAAMALLDGVKPAASPDDLDEALADAQRTLHSHGVTAWQDALVGSFGVIADAYDVYRRAARDGRLTARVNAALFYDPARGIDQIEDLVARRAACSGRFTARSVKIMQDGIPENHTAALHAPYLDSEGRSTDITGESLLPPDALEEVVRALQAADFDMHFHTMGDRALSEVLDALEAAAQPHRFRHQVAHLQSVRPIDIPRFHPLNVTANIQALWAAHGEQMDQLCIPLIGAERAEQQFPFGDLVRAGARLSAGSDWPVSDPSPFKAIHVAVNRVAPGAASDMPVFIARQKLTVAQALTAYTSGGAYVNRIDRSGRIAPGMLADLVVLDRDPFTVPPRELSRVAPVGTFVGGAPVWMPRDGLRGATRG